MRGDTNTIKAAESNQAHGSGLCLKKHMPGTPSCSQAVSDILASLLPLLDCPAKKISGIHIAHSSAAW
jgi:hypothetical protein